MSTTTGTAKKISFAGKKIGKYEIQELLGRGGMGSIYKAYHPTLERDVAIKVIRIDQVNDPTIVDRFRREAKVVASLRHPGIVQIFDFDVEVEDGDDLFYMVMEYVPGESLAQRLAGIHVQQGKIPLAEALRLFRLIVEAVAYAHQRNVIHCDLKPGNVLLTTEGQPILTDFGISKLLSGERLTATDDILGTPHYMSPEQGFGRKIHAPSDVYSLGVILYELTTGVLPFSGDTSLSIVFKHVNEYPRPARAFNPYLPEALEQIIEKALAKKPEDRYPSARELLAAIDNLIDSQKTTPFSGRPASIFICYKPHTEPDQNLANYLRETLAAQGHHVSIDPSSRPDETSLEQIDEQIEACDLFIVLLSEAAADSEMVKSEISLAHELFRSLDKPHILPVRLAYAGSLPYATPAFPEPQHYIDWKSEIDNARVVEEILNVVAGRLPAGIASLPPKTVYETGIVSEDGRLVVGDETSAPPLPAFDPRILQELVVPGGAVKLRDKLYIERAADAQLKDQIVKWGTTTTIRAPRQTGKTSLLMRGINYAREQGANVVFLDFQSFGSEQLTSLDLFLQELAETICDELNLDEEAIEQAWQGSRSSTKKLVRYMEKYVLPAFDQPIVLAMDEADSLLQTSFYKDFFGLLRSWHNRRASRVVWEKLNIVLVISTEPYLLIDDIHQSPFNVGLHLGLTDFDQDQVRDLNFRHGSPVAEPVLSEMMGLLNGHPFLTRLALYKLVTAGLSWTDLHQQAHTDHGPFGDHLRHQYWIIHDKPELKETLKDIIRTKCCPDEVSLFRLLQAGLIKGSGNEYACRCDLYRLYFEDKLF